MYGINEHGSIFRYSDNSCIPKDENNKDYSEYLSWISAGNKPTSIKSIRSYRQFTGIDKFNIFTQKEQRSIAAASMIDVDIKLFYDRFAASNYVTYDDQEMIEGLKFMESNGLISPERHKEIIAEMTSL